MVTVNLSFLDDSKVHYHSTLQLESVKDVDLALDAELSNLKMAIFSHIYHHQPSLWHDSYEKPNLLLLTND